MANALVVLQLEVNAQLLITVLRAVEGRVSLSLPSGPSRRGNLGDGSYLKEIGKGGLHDLNIQ